MTADLDPEEFRRLGHSVVDWIADHRAGSVTTRPEHVDQLWDQLRAEAAAVRGRS